MVYKIDLTEEDKATTGARGFEPLPSGFYSASITDISIVEVQGGPNKGKDMFNVEFTLSDEEGPAKNRKLWVNVMLFDLGPGNNWFLVQFLKATGNSDAVESGQIPDAEDFEGKEVILSVRKVKDDYKNKNPKKYGEGPHFKNNVNGFKLEDDETSTTSSAKGRKKNSILP